MSGKIPLREFLELKIQHERELREAHEKAIVTASAKTNRLWASGIAIAAAAGGLIVAMLHYFGH